MCGDVTLKCCGVTFAGLGIHNVTRVCRAQASTDAGSDREMTV